MKPMDHRRVSAQKGFCYRIIGGSLREREEAPRIPFYREWAGLSCSCRVAVRRSIPGCCQITLRVESRENARSLRLCLQD